MAPSNSAAVRTSFVIGPGVSWLWLIGTTWVRLIRPTVGFNPTMPLIAAGQVTDPSVSVPTAASTMPAATAAPLPDDDPHGVRSSACGLRTWPPALLHPEIEKSDRMLAHSLRLVLPRMTAPAWRNRATSGASRLVILVSNARLPAVVGRRPRVSILSLMRMGMPCSDPRGKRLASSARACASASGSMASTALICGLRAVMRAIAALVSASACWALTGVARRAVRRIMRIGRVLRPCG